MSADVRGKSAHRRRRRRRRRFSFILSLGSAHQKKGIVPWRSRDGHVMSRSRRRRRRRRRFSFILSFGRTPILGNLFFRRIAPRALQWWADISRLWFKNQPRLWNKKIFSQKEEKMKKYAKNILTRVNRCDIICSFYVRENAPIENVKAKKVLYFSKKFTWVSFGGKTGVRPDF